MRRRIHVNNGDSANQNVVHVGDTGVAECFEDMVWFSASCRCDSVYERERERERERVRAHVLKIRFVSVCRAGERDRKRERERQTDGENRE